MLRPVPMVHVRVQVPNRDGVAATRAIAAEGLLHLVDIAHGRTPFDAAPAGVHELCSAYRDLVRRIRTVMERVGIEPPEPSGALRVDEVTDFAAERDRIAILLEPVETSTARLAARVAAARQAAEEVRRCAADIERIRAASVDLARISGSPFMAVRLAVTTRGGMMSIASMLEPSPHAVIPLEEPARGRDDFLVAAAVPANAAAGLEEALRLAGAEVMALPSDMSMLDAMELQRRVGETAGELAVSRAALDHAVASNRELLLDLERRAEVSLLLLQAQTYFAAAGRFLVISGWLPRDSAARLEQRVRAATGGRAVVEIESAERVAAAEGALRIPILHRNPLLLRPFQKLVDLYGTPSYGEIEPTPFFAVGFLLMFGLMFGDIGQGAVLFSAGWFLFRYVPRFLDYGILLMEAGASSALFGALYGSVFGIHGLVPTIWLEPISDLPRFMMIAVGFGAFVVTAGLTINIINSWRSGDLRAALLDVRGAAGALLYWIVLVVLARAFVPTTVRIPASAIALMVALFVLLLAVSPFLVRRLGHERPKPPIRTTPFWLHALERSIELVDTIFSYFANTISFVRIAAFAAVHAGVFIAIFALADTISSLRWGGPLSIAVHVAGNALVILLEGLTVSVQVLRLEYYEFFGKFFRGGGEAYAPLTVVPDGGNVPHVVSEPRGGTAVRVQNAISR